MLSDSTNSDRRIPVVTAISLTKTYSSYNNPAERLIELITNRRFDKKTTFTALNDVNFTLYKGEVLGIIGVNGAGKSTLLQLIAQTISPSMGSVATAGRVAAILELGSGFNPEFSGRENIYLNAATLGLSATAIEDKISSIIEFSGIAAHIDKPVKTYSSGMLVRLAFSVATSVEPDILIIDEALSVGDGAFRRRSFERIMEIQRSGAAILFCSHSLHQVESFCDRAIWLNNGSVCKIGPAAEVVRAYQDFLDAGSTANAGISLISNFQTGNSQTTDNAPPQEPSSPLPAPATGEAQFISVDIQLDGNSNDTLFGVSGKSCLEVDIVYKSDVHLPPPTAAVALSTETGRLIGSSFSHSQGAIFEFNSSGMGKCKFTLENLPLNTGRYSVGVYLFCENGVHGYAMIDPAKYIEIKNSGKETGTIVFNGNWANTPCI